MSGTHRSFHYVEHRSFTLATRLFDFPFIFQSRACLINMSNEFSMNGFAFKPMMLSPNSGTASGMGPTIHLRHSRSLVEIRITISQIPYLNLLISYITVLHIFTSFNQQIEYRAGRFSPRDSCLVRASDGRFVVGRL